MIQKIKKYVVVTVAALAMLAPGLVSTVPALAADTTLTQSLCTGINNATGNSSNSGVKTNCSTTSTDTTTTTVQDIFKKVINIFTIVVGSVSVIMIIYGGFKYITSGGDSKNVTDAKNTLIYALVGIAVIALAQVLVHFVIGTANNLTTGA